MRIKPESKEELEKPAPQPLKIYPASKTFLHEFERETIISNISKVLNEISPTPFSKILLVIAFWRGVSYQEMIPTLLRMYTPAFPNIIIIGNSPFPVFLQELMASKNVDFLEIPGMQNPLTHCGLVKIFKQISPSFFRKEGLDYDGVFYIRDDLFLNWWNWLDRDFTKVWVPHTSGYHPVCYRTFEHKSQPSYWIEHLTNMRDQINTSALVKKKEKEEKDRRERKREKERKKIK